MGFKAIEPVQITGLTSAPDSTLTTGWNEDINIANFVTIPAPATAVLFYFVNDSVNSQSFGIRHANSSVGIRLLLYVESKKLWSNV